MPIGKSSHHHLHLLTVAPPPREGKRISSVLPPPPKEKPLPTYTQPYPTLPIFTHPYSPLPTSINFCSPLPTSTHLYPPLHTLTHLYPPLTVSQCAANLSFTAPVACFCTNRPSSATADGSDTVLDVRDALSQCNNSRLIRAWRTPQTENRYVPSASPFNCNGG